MVEKAVNAIFALVKKPDVLCENLLKGMAKRLFFSPMEGGATTASTFQLTKFVAALGHVSIQLLIHLDGIESYYKNRESTVISSKAAKNDDEDLDQVAGGSSIDDEITDLVSFVKEKEVLFGKKGLFTLFAPIIIQICLNHKLYPVSIEMA